MKRIVNVVGLVAIAGAFCAVSRAAAQATQDKFDLHCADLATLELKPVQKELGITEAQRAKMNVFADEHAKKVAALRQKYANSKADPSKDLYGYYMELKVKALGQLTAGQLKRLREISLQRIGLIALCDPVVAKQLHLTDGQAKLLRGTYDEGYKKFTTIEQTEGEKVLGPYKGRKPKNQQEATSLQNEVKGKLEAAKRRIEPQLAKTKQTYDRLMKAILTPAQLNAYENLRGKPFNPG